MAAVIITTVRVAIAYIGSFCHLQLVSYWQMCLKSLVKFLTMLEGVTVTTDCCLHVKLRYFDLNGDFKLWRLIYSAVLQLHPKLTVYRVRVLYITDWLIWSVLYLDTAIFSESVRRSFLLELDVRHRKTEGGKRNENRKKVDSHLKLRSIYWFCSSSNSKYIYVAV